MHPVASRQNEAGYQLEYDKLIIQPLELYRLIKKMTLVQMEDQYPFATVYDQELNFYSFWQETMSNPQWYEKFNTKVDVGSAIGVTRWHKVLLEYVAQENHTLTFIFAQKGGRGCRGGKGQPTITFDKEYWKDKTCFNCSEKGHPSSSCTKAAVANDDDNASIVQSIKKLAKETKNLTKAFTQLQKTTEQDSDLSGSESEEEDSHFQLGDGFQFTQMNVKQTAIEFEPQIAKLFKQTHGTKIKLDLKKVILLDSQSIMDLICDPALVELTFKSSHSMRLKRNGRTMEVKKTSNHARISCARMI
jgi:hypothetical protein